MIEKNTENTPKTESFFEQLINELATHGLQVYEINPSENQYLIDQELATENDFCFIIQINAAESEDELDSIDQETVQDVKLIFEQLSPAGYQTKLLIGLEGKQIIVILKNKTN